MSNQIHSDALSDLIALANNGYTSTIVFPDQLLGADVEYPVFVAPNTGINFATIKRVTITAAATITGAATNLQTFTLNVYKADGTSATVGAGGSTAKYVTTATATAFKPVDITGNTTTNPIVLAPGQVLALKDVHSGNGAATTALLVTVEWIPDIVL